MNRRDEAIEKYQQSIEIQQSLFGERSDIVASSMVHLATVLITDGVCETALLYFRKALRIKQHLFGKNCVFLSSFFFYF